MRTLGSAKNAVQCSNKKCACRREPNSHQAAKPQETSRPAAQLGRVARSTNGREKTATAAGQSTIRSLRLRKGEIVPRTRKSCLWTSAGGAQRRKIRHHPGSPKRLRAPDAKVFSQLVGPPGRATAQLVTAGEGGGFKTRTATVSVRGAGRSCSAPPRVTGCYGRAAASACSTTLSAASQETPSK